MAEKVVKAKTGTTSARVEVVIGSGAKALVKAIAETKKVLQAAEEAGKIAESITEEISVKSTELANLETQYEEAKRKADADLKLIILENKKAAVTEILAETGQVAVDKATYDATIAESKKLSTDFTAEVAKETAKAKAIAEAAAKQDAKVAEANANATNAQQAANLNAAQSQVEFYKSQVTSLLKQLDDERNARVAEAQARGNAVVNVTNGK